MKLSYKIVIAYTSSLILLYKINELEILKQLFEEVYVTEDIAREFGKELPEWIMVKPVIDQNYKKILQIEVDEGESSAMALHVNLPGSILILDDLKARKIADKLGLKYTGTFGVLLRARKIGLINELKPIIEKIKATNFRFSSELFRIILNSTLPDL